MKKLLKILAATAFFATILLAGTLSSCDGEASPSPSTTPVSSPTPTPAPTPTPTPTPEPVTIVPAPFATPEPTATPDYLAASERKYDEDGVYFTEYTYDERGNMLTEYSTEYEWRERQNIITDELLAMTDFSDLGRLVSSDEYTYDDQNRVIENRYTSSSIRYDDEGNRHVSDPLYESVDYREYDGNIVRRREEGEIYVGETEYDDLGRKVAYRYYYDGELEYEHNYIYTQNGNTYTMEQYDEYFYETSFEQGLVRREERTYDEQGRLVEEIRDYIKPSRGAYYERVERDYDDADRLIEERYYNRADVHWHTEYYTYDEAGRLLVFRQDYITHYSTGLSTGSGGGTQASQISPEAYAEMMGNGYDNIYNELGQLIEVRNLSSYDIYEGSVFYSYDEHGNCIREETRTIGGNLTELVEREYVKLGEVEPEFIMTYYVESIFDVVRDERTYDETGRILTSYMHGMGDTIYFYDELGRLSREEQYDIRGDDEEPSLWWHITYTYHADGTYTKQSTYYGLSDHSVINSQYTYLCDESGNVLEAEWWDTYADGVHANTSAYEYDDREREISYREHNEDGSLRDERTWVYTETADSYITEGFRYDERTFREAYYYDEKGREIRHDYAAYGDYAYSWSIFSDYDEDGNLVEKKRYEGGKLTRTEVHTYDEAGRILSTRIHRGSSGAVGLSSVSAEYFHSGYDYVYDEQGRLIEKTAHNWREATEGTVTTYTYDEFGNCIREDTVMMNGNTYGYIERRFVRRADAE